MIVDSVIAFLSVYRIILIVRIILSWFPDLHHTRFFEVLCALADPYLEPFRRIIPPIGGTIDISPIIAFFALHILQNLIISWL